MPLGRTKAERLAMKLRSRCIRALGVNEREKLALPDEVELFVNNVTPLTIWDQGYYAFEMGSTGSGFDIGSSGYNSDWICRIVIAPDGSVYYENLVGTAPKNIVSCATEAAHEID